MARPFAAFLLMLACGVLSAQTMPSEPPQILPPLKSGPPPQSAPSGAPQQSAQPPQGTDDDYKLGIGDLVRVTVYDQPDLTTDAEVSGTGGVSMPLVGDVQIGGKTRAEAARTLGEAFKRGGFLKEANVIVRVVEYRSQLISVLGEVSKPGRYSIARPSSVAEMIAIAGGITPKGSQVVTVTQVSAGGETKKVDVNVNDQIASSAGKALMLRAGDTVYVPPAPMVYVYGEVRAPGAYPLQPEMTVLQALSVGGGITTRGTDRGIRVERRNADGSVRTYSVRGQDRLQANDVLRVPESWF